MTVAQFLLPGESVLYGAPEEVYYRRTPFALYVTGERLLLYAATGRLASGERAVAEPLAGVESVEYSERGLLSRYGRLDVRFPGHVLTLTGGPDTIKAVWRALQQHAPARGVAADDETTLVAPPPPLFDDQQYPPAQVEPLGVTTTTRARRRKPSALRHPAVVALLVCLASALTVAGLLRLMTSRRTTTRAEPPAAKTTPASTPVPTPDPTPVTLRLLDENFTLEGGAHRAVQFNVPQGVGSARVAGGFRVTWGSALNFYVMSREQYEHFAAGGEPDVASAVYRRAQWNARVGERLQPGDYCLVFDNRDPGDAAQTVAAEFFLTYDPPAAP